MARLKLEAEKREILGRKVKNLRKQGILPANIYGKKIKSEAIGVKVKDFVKIHEEVGETGIIDLSIKGEEKPRPVLIHNVQRHPLDDSFLHVDFHQVILTEKVKVKVPLELVGEAPAETQKTGILVQIISEIEVEALPADLPERFQIDVSFLTEVGKAILIKDLNFDREKIKLEIDENQIIAKIEPLAKEEVVVAPTEETTLPEEGKEKEEEKTPESPSQETTPKEENQ